MVRIFGSPGRSRRLRTVGALASCLLLVGLILAPGALAVHDLEFQLDGNVIDNPASAQDFDWANLFDANGNEIALPAGFTASAFDRDFLTNANGTFNTSDTTTFTTGSKDTLPISPGWQCAASANVNSKIDVMNSYAATYEAPNGNEILYFGLERNANTGTANVAFWFLQDDVACDASGGTTTFSGDHVDGDLLIVSEFTNGGTVSTINVYEWDGGDNGSLNPNPIAAGVDCDTTTGSDTVCATSNKGATPITTPWLTSNKQDGPGHSLRTSEFFEGGLNLTLAGLGGRCFNTFTADTRSSTSLTATLFDFSLGILGSCDSTLVTTPSAGSGGSVSIGTGSVNVTDSADLDVTGADTWSGTLSFFLCGPIAAPATCTTGGTQIGSAVAVNQGTTMPVVSAAATVTSAGRYCWRGFFDSATEGVPDATDSSTGECFTVNPVTPTIPTQVSNAGPVAPGTAISDTATLTGAATPSNGVFGTITFRAYGPDDATCATAVYTSVANVVAGQTVYNSFTDGDGGVFAPTGPGTYRWRAFYAPGAGDANNLAASGACGADNESFIVEQFQPALTTTQTWTVKDKATITVSGGGNLTGTAHFALYDNNTCTGTALYTQDVAVSGASPQNPETTPFTFTASQPTLYWKVSYTSTNSSHANIAATCTENSSLTINN
jgi:hypothetical protein